jgi:Low psii accumulation1 / Rep27
MTNKRSGETEKRFTLKHTDPEKYAFLKAEAAAPYRSLRQFVYLGVAASGAIGAFIFFTQLLAGQDVNSTLSNLALQIGVVTLMIWLFRLESKIKRRSGL